MRVEQTVLAAARPGAIDAAPVELRIVRIDRRVLIRGAADRHLEILITRPAALVVELAGNPEDRIAQRLGLEPMWRVAPQPAIACVPFGCVRTMARGLRIG